MNKLFIVPFFFLFAASGTYGQGTKKDTVFLSSSIKNTKALYDTWIGGQSHLYNGVATNQYGNGLEIDAFYLPDWEDGAVYYDDELHTNVPLMYDLVSDKVVVSHFYTHNEIELISKKIAWFSIGNHRFVHLGTRPAAGIDDGFYEVLYDGNVKLFARRRKLIEDQIVGNKVEYDVNAINLYFIYRAGKYIQVKKQSSVLTALSDKKKELQSFSKKNNLDFRKKTDMSLIRMVQYYDQETE